LRNQCKIGRKVICGVPQHPFFGVRMIAQSCLFFYGVSQ
jgi:hypothetical protein